VELSVQTELMHNLSIEIAYSGFVQRPDSARSIRQDYLPEQYWNGDQTRNVDANTFLTANDTNPFRITNFTALQTSNPRSITG
jgi:LPS O-antigen subunit length determinant protein (WzzB/FepE family)